MIGEEKPSLDDLVHFGVRGMRWGKRKSAISEPSKDPPKTYSTHLPTQEQLLSETRTPSRIDTSPQENVPNAAELSKDVKQMVIRSAGLMAAGVVVTHGPSMKTTLKFIKNSPRLLRGKQIVGRQGKSLLYKIATLPVKSLTPVKGSVRLIGRSLNNSRN